MIVENQIKRGESPAETLARVAASPEITIDAWVALAIAYPKHGREIVDVMKVL